MQIAICCDFDGTITLEDTGKVLLTSLTDKDWQFYDKLVINGEIGTREALVNQWGMIEKTSLDEINMLVDKIKIDPTFIDFYNWVKEKNFKFIIVSDGFKSYINRIFKNHQIHIPEEDIKANDMKLIANKISLDFLTSECSHDCANCKFSHVQKIKNQNFKIIYIGDGLSDIFPAQRLADVVFAKEEEDLAKVLKDDTRLHTFSKFTDIIAKMKSMKIV